MTSVNTRINTAYLEWSIDLERLNARTRSETFAYLMELREDIVTKLAVLDELKPRQRARYINLIDSIDRIIKRYYKQIEENNNEYLQNIAELEAAQVGNIANEALKVEVLTTVLTPAKIQAITSDTIVNGAPSSEWWAKQSNNLRDAFSYQIRMGMGAGESIQDMVRRVRGRATGRRNVYYWNGKKKFYVEFAGGIMDIGTRQAEALVRSSALAVANAASEATFDANKDIIKGKRALATLDMRTTPICRLRDGWAWDMEGMPIKETGAEERFPGRPPWHWNCRTRLVPITKSFQELAKKNKALARRLDRNMDKGTRASMDGQVPKKLTYEEWLRGQSEARQIQVLGHLKQKLWKDGLISFRQLVDQTGNELTIKQLTETVLRKQKGRLKKYLDKYVSASIQGKSIAPIWKVAYDALPKNERLKVDSKIQRARK